ncbi:MAG: excinuclease ABC subunit UvrC [Acidimicrobiia bacterium]|nr:excinuclease ABC subunit UvrC [Acidimicrobiia bacterium]
MVEHPPPGSIPDAPGSYQFKDRDGRVIYVGKAKSLRARLSTYFADSASLPPRTAQIVAAAESVEWIRVDTDVEALLLENELIKRYQPRFNVRLRDDKSYPDLAVTVDDEWPRARVMRGAKRKGVRYFGPYGHAYAIRETLDLLLRTFPIRTCSDAKLKRHQQLGRPCLLFHIEKCSGPCVGEVDPNLYRQLVDDLIQFLDGDTAPVVQALEREMRDAADELDFERAARLRDRLSSVNKAVERQQIVVARNEDLDVIGIEDDELEAAVQVFFVRRGRVTGRKGFVVDKVEELTPGELVDLVVERLYADGAPNDVPKQVLVPDDPADHELHEEWLSGLRGSKVVTRVPKRGDKRALLETVTRNAREEFLRHRLERASDHNARARALRELQDQLELPVSPLRIECYDMSHIQGSDYVGSMVVMEDGLLKKSDYRRFKVRDAGGNDDYAAMEEVLERRLRAYLAERDVPVSEREGRFSYPPQLLLVDGGRGQLAVAQRVVEDLGLAGEIPVAALAKRLEEVFVPGQADPVTLPRRSEALYLLQRVRDEAHRFAVDYHRKLRGKRMTRSELDDVRGLGPVRRDRLLKELGDPRGAFRIAGGPGVDQLVAERGRSRPPRPAARTVDRTVGLGLTRPKLATRPVRCCFARARFPCPPRPVSAMSRAPTTATDDAGGPDLWERHAGWWQRTFTDGADPEYEEQILPLAVKHLDGARHVVDVGTGEGQLARALAARRVRVVGVDPTGAQVTEARRRGGGPLYGRAAAAALPFADGSFDAAVACLVFEHIHEVDEAVAEVARVLEPGGRFVFLSNHPLLQTPGSGWIDDQVLDPPEQYWRVGPYLVEDEVEEQVERGVFVPFVHRPLSRYVNTMAAAGLRITHMDEPAPPEGFLRAAPEYREAATIPRLLVLVAEKS